MHVNASGWIALVVALVGGGGIGTGGIRITAKLTRLVVAIEQGATALAEVVKQLQGHETRISQLEGQQQAKQP